MPELFTKCEECKGCNSRFPCAKCGGIGFIPYGKTTEQVEKVRERLEDWEDTAKSVMAEECAPDEKHCTCVPVLRMEIKRMREAAEEALREIEEYLGGGIGTGGLTCAEADLKQALKAEGGGDE